MYTEYCNYNRVIHDYEEEKKQIFEAIDNGLKGLSMPIHLIRDMGEYLPDNLLVSAPIDYPCGLSPTKIREHMAINSLNSGANALDYVPNHYFLKNKFTELRKEVETIIRICDDHDAPLRVFLDYRNSDNIITISKILNDCGVDLFFPTVGYHHDDFFDNIINSKLIEDQVGCSVIFNGYMWKPDQLDFIKESGLFGVRLYNLKLLV